MPGYIDRNKDEGRVKVKRTLKTYFSHFEIWPRICRRGSPPSHDTAGAQLFTAGLAFIGPGQDQGHRDQRLLEGTEKQLYFHRTAIEGLGADE